jgi:antitoxin component YwqK of YwqJK toxin-antitoxin module
MEVFKIDWANMKHIKLYEQAEPEKRIKYHPDGSVKRERWHQNGKLHRPDGPAWIWYRLDGSVEEEEWYQNGKLHRLDGPAWIGYRPDGSVEWEWWYWHGEHAKEVTTQEEWEAWKYLKSIGLI